jgi:hypothetical protein
VKNDYLVESFKIFTMDNYTLFQPQNPFQESIFELFFGYSVYKLVESASGGTAGFEPAIAKAIFDVWISPKVTIKERGQD